MTSPEVNTFRQIPTRNMSAMIQESTLDRVKDYQERNVSNNGQLLYNPGHKSKVMGHDDMYFGKMDFILHSEEHNKPINHYGQTNQRFSKHEKQRDASITEHKNVLKSEVEVSENNKEHDKKVNHDKDLLDDIEIVFHQDKNTGELFIEPFRSKNFCQINFTKDTSLVAASFNLSVKNHENRTTAFPSVDELVASSNTIAKEPRNQKPTTGVTIPTKHHKNAHVHFSETPQKHIKLTAHRMVKSEMNYEKQEKGKTQTKNASDVKNSNQDRPAPKSPQRSTHSSSSDSNVNKSPTRKSVKSNSYSGKSNNSGTIQILRRDCENVSSMEQTKPDAHDKGKSNSIDYGPEHVYESIANKRHHFYKDDSKLSKQTIRINDPEKNIKQMNENTENGNGWKLNDANYDANKKYEDNKERERQKKQLRKKKKQNKVKVKIQKSDIEIFQRQFETGQMKSMISRYKTDSLKNVKLLEQIHRGIYRTLYKASYQNKKVVLTVYDEEYTDEIKLSDMALMAMSYFVNCLNDYMVGPRRQQWSMSMYHPFGDLQVLLTRDQDRHVIGEAHAQFITAGVLLGLDYLHHNGIVHGNLKPSKILINSLGYPVVTGFVKSPSETRRDDMNPFTPAYAAQERRTSRNPAIDIFSAGVVAYEMITASIPLVGYGSEKKNIHELFYDPELFSYAGELFIQRCLQYDPSERFTIGECRENLLSEEWFSTLDWRNVRRQTLKSPMLNAIQLIDNKATLSWEEKCVQYDWGTAMDALCPNHPTLQDKEDCKLE